MTAVDVERSKRGKRARRVPRGHQPADELHLSYDRKVAPRGWWQASRRRWVPTVPNSFGLPAGASCPGRTDFCASCYAAGNENYSGVAALVGHNLKLLTAALAADGVAGAQRLIATMIGRYLDDADAIALPANERLFRIHWDGDFFSEDYAAAWANVIVDHPDIRFWAYTRSFRHPVDVTPHLAGIPNLALYLSVDPSNAGDARTALARHPSLMLAGCDTDYDGARQLLHSIDLDARPVVCPENAGRIGHMTDGVGACVECELCVDGRRHILFSTTHREHASIPVHIRHRPINTTEPSTPPSSCGNPECAAPLEQHVGPGRKKAYCGTTCRNRARYLRGRP